MPPLPHQKPTTPPPSSSTPPRPSTPPPSFCPPSPPVSFDASPRVRPFPVPEVDKIALHVKKTAPGMRIQEPELRTEKYQTVRLKSLDQLRYYLSTNSLRTALESAPHWQLSFHPIPDSVSGPLLKALSDRPYIRLDYNPISSTLRLWMASPLHDCMQGWASDMMTLINDYLLIRAPDQRLRALVSKHRLAVSLYSPPDGPDTAYLPPTTISRKRKAPVDPLQPRKKPAAIHKSPDYSWTLHGVKYPLVVFEAAWTETPQDLDDDAEQWLIKTSGGTRVVVTILFVEKDSPYKLRKRELRQRYAQLQAQQEAEEGDQEGVEPPSSPLSTAPSTASDHHAERAAINADEWVGSITTHITVWRYKGSSCTGQRSCDGKVTIYPNGSTRISTPPPRIYLKDVYDKKAGGDDDEEDRVFEFNWAALHKELQVGRVDYALERKLNAVKKIRQEFGF